MRKIGLTIAGLFLCALVFAQTARVQIIHNSPTPGTTSGPTVDVYVNDLLLPDLAGFEFRTATPFVDVPTTAPLTVDVRLSPSTIADPIVATFELGTLTSGATYVISATGVVGDMATPFDLAINAMGLEAATDPANVAFAAYHGSPDAPNVDIDARTVGNLIPDLPYGSYSDYLEVAPGVYYIDVRAAGSPDIVQTFQADLSGLAGGAATVFASGFLGDTPGFGLFAALPDGTVLELPASPVARMQIIHNSPSPTVDIYANGGLVRAGLEFRTATEYIFVPAGVALDIQVVPTGGDPINDDVYLAPAITLDNGQTYIVTAIGEVGNAVYPFDLAVQADARETATDPANIDFNVLHGSPDAPNVDIDERLIGNLIENLAYGSYSDYLSVTPDVYYVDVRANGSTDIVQTYQADLTGLEGFSATLFASGFLSGGDPAFGLFGALPDGTVVELPASPVARVQIIHNSPDPTVDIYANDGLIISDFAFRDATEFIYVPAGVDLDIQVVPAGQPSSNDIYTEPAIALDNGATYVVVAGGLVGDPDFPFTLFISEGRETGATLDNVDLNILHGAPGVPAVDVAATGVVTATLIEDLEYGNFSGYATVPAAPYFIDLIVDGVGTVPFFANLEGTEGGAATVFASGLFGGTPGLGVFAAFPDGTVVELPLIDKFAQANILHNSPAAGAEVVDVYLNGAILLDDFEFRTATGFVDVPAEVLLNIGVAPGNSTSVADTIATFRFENGLVEDGNYLITAAGIPGDMMTPFTLQIEDMARQAAGTAGQVDVNVLHSSPGAPNVDVDARAVVTNLIEDLAYGTYTDYLTLAPDLYYLDVRAAGSPGIVATFEADLSGAADAALTVFASGILGGTPGFGLFTLSADGSVNPLPLVQIARAQIIHNSPDPSVDIYLDDNLAFADVAFRQATTFNFVPAEAPVNVKVVPAGGNPTMNAVFDADVTFGNNGDVLVIMAHGVVGNGDTPFTLSVFDQAREASAGGVDLLLFHGSPDAPDVDVVVDATGAVLFDDLAYGNFSTGYANVPEDIYVLNITPAADNNTVVASYEADLTGLEGGAATVFASGFFDGTDPSFGVWVALPDATTFPLPQVLSTADLGGKLVGFAIAPNPANDAFQVSYQLEAATEMTIEVRDALGRLVAVPFQGFAPAGLNVLTVNENLNAGSYSVQLRDDSGVVTRKLMVVR